MWVWGGRARGRRGIAVCTDMGTTVRYKRQHGKLCSDYRADEKQQDDQDEQGAQVGQGRHHHHHTKIPRTKSSSMNPNMQARPYEQAANDMNPLMPVPPQSSPHGRHHDPTSTTTTIVKMTIRLDGKLSRSGRLTVCLTISTT